MPKGIGAGHRLTLIEPKQTKPKVNIMSTLTKEQKDEFKAVKQFLIMHGLIAHVANLTYDNMDSYQEELIAKGLLDHAYGEEPGQDAQNADGGDNAQDATDNAQEGQDNGDSTGNDDNAQDADKGKDSEDDTGIDDKDIIIATCDSQIDASTIVKPQPLSEEQKAAFITILGEVNGKRQIALNDRDYQEQLAAYNGTALETVFKAALPWGLIKDYMETHNASAVTITRQMWDSITQTGDKRIKTKANTYKVNITIPTHTTVPEEKTSKSNAGEKVEPIYIIDGKPWTGRGQMLSKLLEAIKKDSSIIAKWTDDKIKGAYSEKYAENNYSKADHELVRQVLEKYKIKK